MNMLNQYFCLYLFFIFVLGLIVGSFLNVVIYRLPKILEKQWREECSAFLRLKTLEKPTHKPFNLLWPGSHCPCCQEKISPWHNIPLLSFFLLKGKCAHCGKKISWQYPVVELLCGLLSLITAWKLGASYAAFASIFFVWCLIALAAIDLKTRLLPDQITLPLLWLGLFFNLFGLFTDMHSAIVGAMAAYLSLWVINYIFKLLKHQDGMGYGDFKLFAVFGAWFGWQYLLLIILIAAALGAVVGISLIIGKRHDRGVPIPFGPYLALAGWVSMLWGTDILYWYLGI